MNEALFILKKGFTKFFHLESDRHTIVILMFVCVRVYQRVHLCENINAVLTRL